MGLKKNVAKLNDYYDRLKDKKADRIKADHVVRVIEKLKAKRAELTTEIETASKPEKKKRLEQKLAFTSEQIERADWLLAEIEKNK